MHPRETAAQNPEKRAIVLEPSGAAVTYGELAGRSNRAAQLLRSLGLRVGDGIAVCMENLSKESRLVLSNYRQQV